MADANVEWLRDRLVELAEARRGDVGMDRANVIAALSAVVEYLNSHVALRGDPRLKAPLMELGAALQDLDEGRISPLLRPAPKPHGADGNRRGGAPPWSPDMARIVPYAVATSDGLCQLGLNRTEANAAVANALTEAGVRATMPGKRGQGERAITATTVKQWRSRLSKSRAHGMDPEAVADWQAQAAHTKQVVDRYPERRDPQAFAAGLLELLKEAVRTIPRN
ncbi:hypothetical protein [uncultured Rhodospira sp.]|uniref:hypothetical protein n=1 Tax=uncultured Rhodospira sp. TaxID=1936189 RepID=UPI00262DFA4F|nr:hypothetical protein [uncultured Rhodospira sp.]